MEYVIKQPGVPPPMAYLSPKNEFLLLSAWWIDEENNLWSSGSPAPQALWADVARFQAMPPGDPQGFCVLTTEGRLIVADGTSASATYDANVAAFQVVTWNPDLVSSVIYVLGTDGNLWLESQPKDAKLGQLPTHVDGNVAAFQALDENHVFVLGRDGNLWVEPYPWLNYVQQPQDRTLAAAEVVSFWVVDENNVYVRDTAGVLTLRQAPWDQPGPDIATSVLAFAYAPNGVYWITEPDADDAPPAATSLYLSTPSAPGAPWLQSGPIDEHVTAIACNSDDPDGLLVLGSDGNLWYEPKNYDLGKAQNINRTQVASGVWTHPLLTIRPSPGP